MDAFKFLNTPVIHNPLPGLSCLLVLGRQKSNPTKKSRTQYGSFPATWIDENEKSAQLGSFLDCKYAKILQVILYLSIIFLLSSCVDTKIIQLGETRSFEPTTEVGILYRYPGRPFLTIATIESAGDFGTTHQQVLEQLRDIAKNLGAHAIIIKPAENNENRQQDLYNPVLKAYNKMLDEEQRTITAVAIRFSEQEPEAIRTDRPIANAELDALHEGDKQKSNRKIGGAIDALTQGNEQKAFLLLQPLAEQGDSRAQTLLGDLYSSGYVIPRDYTSAYKWYMRAAEQGEPNAQIGLGLLYADGNGKAKDQTKANQWFLKAIPQLRNAVAVGDVEAQFNLAVLKAKSYGIEKNPMEALKLLTMSAQGGYYRAQLVLGLHYLDDTQFSSNTNADAELFADVDFTKNNIEAAKWLIQAAEQGNKNAAVIVGGLYLYGVGVQQDGPMSVRWYRKAAESGHPVAQVNLGIAYLNGQGVLRDYAEAERWLRLAANQKYGHAQQQMGYLYEAGKGVKPSISAAVGWFYEAGLTYLEDGMTDKALSMVDHIEKARSNDPLAEELRTRINQNKVHQ